MAINEQIIDEKLQYDVNREAAKLSALLPGKINKYEYLTGEEILSSSQKKIKWNNVNVLILHWEEFLKNKKKSKLKL